MMDTIYSLIGLLFLVSGISFFVTATIKLLSFRPCPCYSVAIYFSRSNTVSDVTIPIPGPAEIATAVVSNAQGPIAGAVFDSISWSVQDSTIASIVTNADQTATVTAVDEGTTIVDFSGVYQGFPLSTTATVTVTLVNGGFVVNIEWTPAEGNPV